MKIVSTSYSKTTEFTDPKQWLEQDQVLYRYFGGIGKAA